ncbi:MAG: hypothetical protein P8Y64_12145 [Gammaproteobacteria bacterium]
MGLDAAVVYALLSRGYRAAAGLVSILLIGHFLSAVEQGYFYTFQSLVALQAFVELGLFVVVVNVTSHEWSRLELDSRGRIVGDAEALSRLISFGRKLATWYAGAAVVFVLVVAPLGAVFMAQNHGSEPLVFPWVAAVFSQALLLWVLPFQAIYEGCNQIVSLHRFQFWQTVVSQAALWGLLIAGAGVWSVAGLLATQAVVAFYFLGVRNRAFFRPFYKKPKGPEIDWEKEVWPMQWRLALQGAVNYFMYSVYTPVIFHYHGAVEAGRFGMTWQIFNVIQSISLVWVQTRVPRFGTLVADRRFDELDTVWRRMTVISFIAYLVVIAGFLGTQSVLGYFNFSFIDRLLDVDVELLLIPIGIGAIWVQCAALYWRSHKIEALGFMGVVPSLVNGALVWWLGARYGSPGALSAYILTLLMVMVPLVTYLKMQVARTYRTQAGAQIAKPANS